MTAGVHDFPVEQEATFRQRITWAAKDAAGELQPYDLTDCTARMQVRTGYDGETFLTLSTENGGLTLGGSAGTIDIHMRPSETDQLTVAKPRYDLMVIFPSGDARRVLEGRLLVRRNITELESSATASP